MARRRVCTAMGMMLARRGHAPRHGKGRHARQHFQNRARAGRMPGCRPYAGKRTGRRHSVLAAPAFSFHHNCIQGKTPGSALFFAHPARRRAPHGASGGKAFGHIQNALVFRACGTKGPIALRQHKSARPQECPAGPKALLFRRAGQKLFKRIAGIACHLIAGRLQVFCQRHQRPRPGRTARRPKTSPRAQAGLPSPWRTVLPQTYLCPHQTPSSRGCGHPSQ